MSSKERARVAGCENRSIRRNIIVLVRWKMKISIRETGHEQISGCLQDRAGARNRRRRLSSRLVCSGCTGMVIIILVIFLLGGFSGRFGGYGYGFGHGGIGVIGVILIILVVLLLMGRM